ncbi:peptidylprolyl isomerase [Mycolicibacterium sphagni]|uniref:Peptidyl-prolyl cis-trans isomerase n=1 Tax=Mycolicibacterium sphagni TaxID=1786 RepID=A0A255DZY4_9MYCO|nr:peptidylprolyl isomerase [Mycolicibacterium sphagni]MCV7180113.1 peptidylprolyl isomerase [Mycolicibacterium sphagni]OYN82692.1 peptidylprolyl isomerase [Mycolicibacterium sphagni]
MPTNEQRRATAKRKLERQLERRAQQEKRRRLFIVIGGVVAIVVAAALVATFVLTNKDDKTTSASSTSTSATADAGGPSAAPPSTGGLPPFKASANLGANCQYPATPEPASKKVDPPHTGKVPTTPATVTASMSTNQGNLGLNLDNAKAPCTVNSFASLAQKGFFNDTPCHRLTTSPSLSVLQCGDPTGQGTGGPGYQFANEYPTDQYPEGDPALQQPVTYPRGTLAMANAGPGTNGSQFFLVYKDSQLPPNYTAFGTIDATGLATLDKIAAAGVDGGGQDGKPATAVQIKSILLD